MLNNAKFFTSPATPEVTLTVVLHVGQSMVLPWSSLSKQLEQKVCPQLSIRGHRSLSLNCSQQIGHSRNSMEAII